MDIFTGTHLIRVERDDTMQDGFSVSIAEADATGKPITKFSRDSTVLYGGNWRHGKLLVFTEIIRHLLPK